MQTLLITGGNSKLRLAEAQKIAAKNSSKFDTVIIDGEVEKGIESARDIINSISRKPFESKVTSVIIKQAQNLTHFAQNALLKTLEEPNESCQIILTAVSADNLLPTVVSRCIEINLANVAETKKISTPIELTKYLEYDESESLDNIIAFWQRLFKESAIDNKRGKFTLQALHRYNKVLLRLKKAEKLSANKKLLSLLAYLELPKTSD